MFSHILLATDGSEGALRAAEAAAALVRKFESRLSIVTVYRYITVAYSPEKFALDELPAPETEEMTGDADASSQIRKKISSPAEEIVRVAEEKGTDLIVLGSRGLGGVKLLLLGSVSDAVARHAHCPVLIVR